MVTRCRPILADLVPDIRHTQHTTIPHHTTQYSTAQHSTAQHSTAQHSTAQHRTRQHSTALPLQRQRHHDSVTTLISAEVSCSGLLHPHGACRSSDMIYLSSADAPMPLTIKQSITGSSGNPLVTLCGAGAATDTSLVQ